MLFACFAGCFQRSPDSRRGRPFRDLQVQNSGSRGENCALQGAIADPESDGSYRMLSESGHI